jgi:hypothetical protein
LKTATKPKGMMFTAESVQAFLAGRKSQTRRLIKGSWELDGDESGCGYDPPKCPYPVGTVVYAKESWSPDHKAFYPNFPVVYKADYHLDIEDGKAFSPETNAWYPFRWRSPLHMPRWAARLWFRVTDVRVQRLCDISEEDAKAEGCDGNCPVGYIPAHQQSPCVYHYAQLWDRINPKTPWADNPWVWCFMLTRIERPEGRDDEMDGQEKILRQKTKATN